MISSTSCDFSRLGSNREFFITADFVQGSALHTMLSCQGVATGTANSQLFGFSAASRHGYPARSSVSSKPASLKLQPPALRHDKKILPLRGTDFFLTYILFYSSS